MTFLPEFLSDDIPNLEGWGIICCCLQSLVCFTLFVTFASCFLISKSWMHKNIEQLEARTEVLLAACDFWMSQNRTRKSDEKMK
jgi:hypothetical protein